MAKPQPLLNVDAKDLGGGCYIQHGFATIIAAKSVGENLWINQCVTIGYSNATDCPTIGNNVPANAVVAGVPAKILKYK